VRKGSALAFRKASFLRLSLREIATKMGKSTMTVQRSLKALG